MRLGVGAAFVDGHFVDGDVEVEGGVISAVGVEPSPSPARALPGYIDVQVNGFAGVDFTTASPDDYLRIAPALAATGVTAYQPTLITLPENLYTDALGALAVAVAGRGPRIIGAHLEGPFLSPAYAGAHDPDNMVEPDLALMDRLAAAGPVTMVTLAPELPGASDLIAHLTGRGIVVACGHSDAAAPAAAAAFDGGAAAVTHLFNAQRPFHHRDPGIAGAALAHERVVVTLIVDGVHLADETVRMVAGLAPDRVALITDAIAATGMGDGTFPLGDRTVAVRGAEPRLDDGTLAGSVLTMDWAVRNVMAAGVDESAAVAAATSTPARLIGKPELGTLSPGSPADVVVVDEDFAVVRTLVAGTEVYSAG